MDNMFGGAWAGGISPVAFRGKIPVDTYNDLPITANKPNDLRATQDTDHLYIWTKSEPDGSLSDWVDIGSTVGNLDSIADGSTYGRVLNSELESGQVKQVRAVSGLSNITGDNIKNLLDNFNYDEENDNLKVFRDIVPLNGTINIGLNSTTIFNRFVFKILVDENDDTISTSDIIYNNHIKGTDIGLDTGGSNPVTAETIKDITDKITFDTTLNNILLGEGAGTSITTSSNLVLIGKGAGSTLSWGGHGVYIGSEAGLNATNHNNIVIGRRAGKSIGGSTGVVIIGAYAGNNAEGKTVLIGQSAGTKSGVNSVVIGYKAGSNNVGSGNVIIGANVGETDKTWDSVLAIDNSDTATPLIYGEFDNRALTINGTLTTTGDVNIAGRAKLYKNQDWQGFVVGLSSAEDGGMAWRYSLHRMEINTKQYLYPILINNSIYVSNSSGNGNVGIGTNSPGAYKLSVVGATNINGDLKTTGEFTMKVYSQTAEPTLDTDNKMAIWKDTDDSNRVYLLFRRSLGDQIKVELT